MRFSGVLGITKCAKGIINCHKIYLIQILFLLVVGCQSEKHQSVDEITFLNYDSVFVKHSTLTINNIEVRNGQFIVNSIDHVMADTSVIYLTDKISRQACFIWMPDESIFCRGREGFGPGEFMSPELITSDGDDQISIVS